LSEIPYPDREYINSELFMSIPEEIRNIIQSSPRLTKSYQFTVGSRIVRTHLCLPYLNGYQSDTLTKREHKYMLHSVRLIWLWMHTVSHDITGDCAETLDIYLYLTQHYKKKPVYGTIDPIHANTAYTRTCEKNSTIQIFREEEWFKVLIHETFHNLGLDFSSMNEVREVFEKTLQNVFHIKTEGLVFETYCEMWATIINTMFVACFSEGFPPKNTFVDNYITKGEVTPWMETILHKMENILCMESKYSLFQSSKVLNYMGISYTDFVSLHIPERQMKLKRYRENTNVFCYYVLKSLLLYHLDDFLRWCWLHNHGSLEFVKNVKNLTSFCELIRTVYQKDSYIREHLYMESVLNETKGGFEHETLRMTIYG
jgi:hypothetical protein